MGNYSRKDGDPDGGPRYCIYRLVFTGLEINENWKMLVNHRNAMDAPVQRMRIRK